MKNNTLIGRGETLSDCFIDIAQNLFALQADISQIQPRAVVFFQFTAPDTEQALKTWLNLLLTQAVKLNMVFSHFQLTQIDQQWLCEVAGEPYQHSLSSALLPLDLNVLLATKNANQWEIHCVLAPN